MLTFSRRSLSMRERASARDLARFAASSALALLLLFPQRLLL